MLKAKRKKHIQFLFQLTALILIAVILVGCGSNTPANEDTPSGGGKVEETPQQKDESEGKTEDTASQSDSGSSSPGSPATAAESYTAYTEAKGELISRLSDALSSNPDTGLASMSLLGIALADLALLPASSFGLGESSVNMALGFVGAKDIEYSESGNQYSVKYRSEDGKNYELKGEYDKAADALKCISFTDGKETIISEHRKTSFGYVSQTYIINDDGSAYVYQLAVSGLNGAIGIFEASQVPPGLTGSETIDFPKQCKEWYAIDGNKVTGVDSDGQEISFEYTPSDEGE